MVCVHDEKLQQAAAKAQEEEEEQFGKMRQVEILKSQHIVRFIMLND